MPPHDKASDMSTFGSAVSIDTAGTAGSSAGDYVASMRLRGLPREHS